MPQRSPFDYDVSVSADKRRRTRRRGMSGAFEARGRRCDRKGCDAVGQYRAPRSPERLDEYWWFCLDHVREYNQAWNYFDNWTEEDFEAFVESDRLWGRPTWRFGKPGAPDAAGTGHAEGRAWARFGFEDPFEVLGENATLNPGREGERVATAARPAARFSPTERRALDALGMPDGGTRTALRERYRALVKDLHPDMNGGARDDEARLREVLWAWDVVKESRRFRD